MHKENSGFDFEFNDIKFGNENKKEMDSSTRAKLIRKGNEFFNNKKMQDAKKIFIVTDYKDGLVRLGDYYYEELNDIFEACRMYFMSENRSKIDYFTKKCAESIRKMIANDEKSYDKLLIKKEQKG